MNAGLGLMRSFLTPMKSLSLLLLVYLLAGSAAQSQAPAHHASHTAGAASGGLRTWTYGDQTAIATLWSVKQDAITLLLENGETTSIKLKELSAMDRHVVAAWQKQNAPPEAFGKPDAVITLTTLKGQMRYDLDEFTLAPGARFQLVFHNIDDMHHNILFCKPGDTSGMEVAQEAWKLGGDGFEKEWIPDHPNVLFASGMVDPHSTRHFYFKAPDKEAIYPYVCTLPGHAAFMKGVLHVRDRPPVFSELTYMLYHGRIGKLAELERKTPEATDHVPSGLIDLSVSKRRDAFALVFDGLLNVPEDGEYTFDLVSDDGSNLVINDQLVVDNDGVHARQHRRGKTHLTKGPQRFRVSYFEHGGEETLALVWSGPGFEKQPLSVIPRNRRRDREHRGLPIGPTAHEARLYRNFIAGAGNRAIGVGYPNGINLAFDADKFRVARIWLGGFMDAARHWNGRGQGHQPPLGYGDYQSPQEPPFATLSHLETKWPEPAPRAVGYTFSGYQLHREGRWPIFTYQFSDIEVIDAIHPAGSLDQNDARLDRTLLLRQPKESEDLYFLAARASTITKQEDGRYLLPNGMLITLKDPLGGATPILRQSQDQWELLLPVRFTFGAATFQQSFQYQLTAE